MSPLVTLSNIHPPPIILSVVKLHHRVVIIVDKAETPALKLPFIDTGFHRSSYTIELIVPLSTSQSWHSIFHGR